VTPLITSDMKWHHSLHHTWLKSLQSKQKLSRRDTATRCNTHQIWLFTNQKLSRRDTATRCNTHQIWLFTNQKLSRAIHPTLLSLFFLVCLDTSRDMTHYIRHDSLHSFHPTHYTHYILIRDISRDCTESWLITSDMTHYTWYVTRLITSDMTDYTHSIRLITLIPSYTHYMTDYTHYIRLITWVMTLYILICDISWDCTESCITLIPSDSLHSLHLDTRHIKRLYWVMTHYIRHDSFHLIRDTTHYIRHDWLHSLHLDAWHM